MLLEYSSTSLIELANSIKEVEEYSNNILGMNLITPQTGVEGKKVLKVYVEEGCQIKKEYYLGIVLDRAKGKFVMMAIITNLPFALSKTIPK